MREVPSVDIVGDGVHHMKGVGDGVGTNDEDGTNTPTGLPQLIPQSKSKHC